MRKPVWMIVLVALGVGSGAAADPNQDAIALLQQAKAAKLSATAARVASVGPVSKCRVEPALRSRVQANETVRAVVALSSADVPKYPFETSVGRAEVSATEIRVTKLEAAEPTLEAEYADRLAARKAFAETRKVQQRRAWATLAKESGVNLASAGGAMQVVELDQQALAALEAAIEGRNDMRLDVEIENEGGVLLNGSQPPRVSAVEAMGVDPYLVDEGWLGDGVGIWVNDATHPDTSVLSSADRNRLIVHDTGGNRTTTNIKHATNVVKAALDAAPEGIVHYAYEDVSGPPGCLIDPNLHTFDPPALVSSLSINQAVSSETDSSYSFCNKLWDEYVMATGILHMAAAGNADNCAPPGDSVANVLGIGKAYNVLTVGATILDDNAFPGPFVRWGSSCYRNPDTGAEKPEIMAPGAFVPLAYPGVLAVGTSFAAPHAAGLAADLISAWPALYGVRPHLMKARMMAAAVDVDGTPLNPYDSIDDQDGFGAVGFRPTEDVLEVLRWWESQAGDLFNEDWDGDGDFDEITFDVWLKPGRTYRFVISWLVDGDSVLSNQKISMDLDLLLIPQTSGWVYTSMSADQNFEYVEFDPPDRGGGGVELYKVVIAKVITRPPPFGPHSTALGFAEAIYF